MNLAELKRKHRNIAEFITTIDEVGKIVLLGKDEFYLKLNNYNFSFRIKVRLTLQNLLGQKLISNDCIYDVMNIIKNEILSTHKSISLLIAGIDEEGKILLVPKKDIIDNLNNIERVDLETAIEDLLEITDYDLVSVNYFNEEWKSRDLFIRIIKNKLVLTEKKDLSDWLIKIKRFVRSDAPINNKVIFLTELLTDMEHAFSDEIDSNLNINFIKSLLNEVVVKQNLEYSFGLDKINSDKIPEKQPKMIELNLNTVPKQIPKHHHNTTTEATKKYDPENSTTESLQKWHSRIFKEHKHFHLFEYLHNQISQKKSGKELADYSFVYWVMYNDLFINEGVKPTEFINWLNKYYEVTLVELKQLYRVNGGNRPENYQSAKLLFQC